jgi:hypothetical protein
MNFLALKAKFFFRLSGAKNIIFIGHGPGCHALMELMESRRTYIVL